MGVDAQTMGVLASYLQDRLVTVRYLGQKIWKTTDKGCVQGSIGGPLLWNMQLDPLLREAENQDAHIQVFANDIVIVDVARNAQKLERKVNKAL